MRERGCEVRRGMGRWALAVVAAALALPAGAGAASKTYTTTADFGLGVLDGVNSAVVVDQLQLNVTGTTFPIMWVANAGEDTVSKIDTVNNKEVARYRTWFGPAGQAGYYNHLGNAYAGAAPSRTCVDNDGNLYVANRHFDGRPADVIKILVDSYVDRNHNGVVDTSTDADNNGAISVAEMLPMADSNGNGIIDDSEIQDERVAWAVSVGPANGLGRSLCIGTDGNLWLGLFNSQQYWKIRASDGAVLGDPISTPGLQPYGCLVDGGGRLWSASLAGALGELDTATNTWTATRAHPGSDYGIALGNGHVYQANYSGLTYTDFNPATTSFATPASTRFSAYGIAVDGHGDIFAGNIGGGVTKFSPTGATLWSRGAQGGTGEVRGVVVDSDNNVWLIHRTSNNLSKYDGATGASLGVFPVGSQPYTYSDATGFAQRNITNKTGFWTVVVDGGANGADWTKIAWNSLVQTGAAVTVGVRTDDSLANLALEAYQPVANGGDPNLQGRYAQIRVQLEANPAGDSPVLYDLTVDSVVEGAGLVCDVDRDGDIDKIDLSLISRARGQRVTDPADPRDADGDGLITPNDNKVCIPRCTRPYCAIQ